MFSRTLTTTVVIALALAMFVAWAGHTYTLSVLLKQSSWEMAQDAHHTHEQPADRSCASCSDHYHSPLTPEHHHETPQLTSVLTLATQPKISIQVDAPRYSILPAPIFLIERPPKPSFAS